MSKTVTGNIERKGLGPGTWALVTEQGETYELQGAPKELLQSGLKAKVQGKIRDDVMTFAMIGPVLEVQDFEVVN